MELPKEYKTPHPMNSLPPEVDGEKGAVYDPSNGDDPAAYHSRGSTHVEAMNRMDQEHNLPITGKRNSTWVHSCFHNTTAMVGAGVLGLPYAFKYLTWSGGIVVLVLSWIISLYTLHQLVDMHEMKGRRFNRYHELGVFAFGPTWGHIIIIVPQLIVMIGLGITYTVTGGRALYTFWGFTCAKDAAGNCETAFGLSAWIVVFTAIQLIVIQAPNFNALAGVSLLAAIMSLTYSTIGIGGSIATGRQPGTVYNLQGHSLPDGIFGVFNSLGIVAFAYGGHNVVLEIQAGLPSPPKTYKRYMNGVYAAYGIVSWCYAGVSITGYWAFGEAVMDNVLHSIPGPTWMLALANFAVFLHVCGSYQIYTMPVMDMIETVMVKRGIPNGLPSRLIYRTIYVVLIAFIACTIPFFGSLMGFIGALGTGPTTFWLPSVLYLVLKRPALTSVHFWASWVCIVLGVLVTIVGSIGGMRDIINSASGYKFYQ